MMAKPLPFVKEVMFIATPHRGSSRSKSWVRKLVRAIVTLPAKIVQSTSTYYDYFSHDVKRALGGSGLPQAPTPCRRTTPCSRHLPTFPWRQE